jgi:hypothetical protein
LYDKAEDAVTKAKKALAACEKKNKIEPFSKKSGKLTKAEKKKDAAT